MDQQNTTPIFNVERNLLTRPDLIKRTIAVCALVVTPLFGTAVVVAQKQVVRVDSKRSVGLIEQFGFSISDYKMDHQGEKNTLKLIIRYRYKPNLTRDDYPDFTLIAKDIENLLGNYPEKSDYWELVNKRLTQMILDKYLTLAEVTSQIEVSPTPSVRYPRTSIVTRHQTASRSRSRR